MAQGIKWTKEGFEKQARIIHGDKYDYPGEYINRGTKMEMFCNIHGTFWQKPGYHLSGSKCNECVLDNLRLDTKSFTQKLTKKHGSRYTVLGEYISSQVDIEILCNRCGSKIFKRPNNILRGSGCRNCSRTGFKPEERGTLYYIKDTTANLYKIGITNLTLKKRFGPKMKEIKVIKTWSFEIGQNARNLEKLLHETFVNKQCLNENFASVGGKLEFFETDILGLDLEDKDKYDRRSI